MTFFIPNRIIPNRISIGLPFNIGSLEWEIKQPNKVDYSKLRRFLAQQKWREADRETGRLILQVSGKEINECLDVADINSFPCQVLRIIDRLWLNYSHGKFGFTVQRDIYQELGGTTEYNRQSWHCFCEKIGWRKKGNFLDYDKLIFNVESAPKGTFPRLIKELGCKNSRLTRRSNICRTSIQKLRTNVMQVTDTCNLQAPPSDNWLRRRLLRIFSTIIGFFQHRLLKPISNTNRGSTEIRVNPCHIDLKLLIYMGFKI